LIVLDTHVLVWWLSDPSKLSARAQRAIKRSASENAITISTISLFEISTLLRRGRLQLGVPSEQWFAALRSLPELVIEPVSAEIAWLAGTYNGDIPGDPADRIITATAHAVSARLITADDKLRLAASVDVVW
jgi:PIN domain nuclease of toxin-antitoxin system